MNAHARSSHPRSRNTQRGIALRQLLKWIGIGVLALIAVLALTLWWLLGSESGARFVLARAVGALDGKLAVARSHGSLGGSLVLEDLRWTDPAAGVDAKLARLRIDLRPLALLAARVHVSALELDRLDLALSTVSKPEPSKPGTVSLAAPIDIALDRLALRGAHILQDGKPVFALDSLDAAAVWTDAGATVATFALRAPEGSLDLHGTIAASAGHAGNAEARLRWKLGEVEYGGTLKAQGDGRKATLALNLDAPTPANLEFDLAQTDALAWTLRAKLPRFDPQRVQAETSLKALALDLEGHGDKQTGAIEGTLTLDEHVVQLAPLRYALDGQTLRIESLALKSPEHPGQVDAKGSLQLDAKPIAAQAQISWNGVELPAELVGQVLATHGSLSAKGNADAFHVDGAAAIGPPGRLSDLAFDLDGTPQTITLKQLALKQAKGGLDAHGTLSLQPALGWDITAKASRLDPGAFAAAWPGALDFDLASHGTLVDQGADATLKLERLGGTLRRQSVSGQADLQIKPGFVVDGTLALSAGKSRIDVSGRGGEHSDATIAFALPALGDWLSDLGGGLDGRFRVQGKWPALAITGDARGRALKFGSTQIAKLDLDAEIANLDAAQGRLALKLDQIDAGALQFKALDLHASGALAGHQLEVDAEGTPLGLKLALDGKADTAGDWNGTLRTLDLRPENLPALALRAPTSLAWRKHAFSSSELCLEGGDASLCASADVAADGALQARYRIDRLPLALLMQLAASQAPLMVSGEIAGTGEIRRSSAGALDGKVHLQSPQGALAQVDHAQAPLLGWNDFALDATLTPQATQASLRANFDHDGKLDGEITLSGPMADTTAMSGHVDLALNSLAFVDLLTPEVANTQGRIRASYHLDGSLAAPQVSGSAQLQGFATEVPAAGLKLHEGAISVQVSDIDHFSLDGTLKSGDGTLTLRGSGGSSDQIPLQATIKGERFLAADIPAAKVLISPDLVLTRAGGRLDVSGRVKIPQTAIDLSKLPGGGASKSSADVMIVDAEPMPAAKSLPLVVGVDIELGDEVKLAGMGLDGQVSGRLRIDQRPGRQPVGTGTLNAQGTYRAYGQNLTIETGHLLFAGSALDNPGLDIRAVRKILGASGGQFDDSLTAGLQVRGTALLPVLTVFSQPPMEQSEALSYLLTGKPLSSLKSGEGDMLGAAARALGSATGDLLAKGIGARLGVDAGVSDNAALGGAAFTVGKYLSPKLYLSYGVGLFTPGEVVTLKYLFSKRWNFEAQNATTGSRAGFNYRHER